MPISAVLESTPDVYSEGCEPGHTAAITAAILDHLDGQMVISLDSLICLIPGIRSSTQSTNLPDAGRSSFAGMATTTRSSRITSWHNSKKR
jgi:hypothetical protein